MNIIPQGPRVLLKRDPSDGKTASGIHLANTEPKTQGTIIAIRKGLETDIKVGDRVLIPKGGGIPVKIDDLDESGLEVFPLENIFAILK